MYPRPEKADLGLPKWLGGITKAAKTGFEVYNVVKDILPEKSTAGAGGLPGSGMEGSEFELLEL